MIRRDDQLVLRKLLHKEKLQHHVAATAKTTVGAQDEPMNKKLSQQWIKRLLNIRSWYVHESGLTSLVLHFGQLPLMARRLITV